MNKNKQLIPKGGDDKIYTPDSLAKKIVTHYNPFGKKCLEPCKGGGAFLRAFQNLGINLIGVKLMRERIFSSITKR